MGMLKNINRAMNAEKKKAKAYQLSKALTEFYATHPFSPWQTAEVEKIRSAYENKQNGLNIAFDNASSRLSEQFMQFELDYCRASAQWKEDHPGQVYSPNAKGGIFSKAFWSNLGKRALDLSITSKENGTEEAK